MKNDLVLLTHEVEKKIGKKIHVGSDFEEELKKFEPSMEIEEAEDAIYNRDLTDMMDILQEMMKESRR